MLHVHPGTAARRLVLWSEPMQESELCATEQVTRWSWSVAQDSIAAFCADCCSTLRASRVRHQADLFCSRSLERVITQFCSRVTIARE